MSGGLPCFSSSSSPFASSKTSYIDPKGATNYQAERVVAKSGSGLQRPFDMVKVYCEKDTIF
jgi:hypothetical protein